MVCDPERRGKLDPQLPLAVTHRPLQRNPANARNRHPLVHGLHSGLATSLDE
jgi:hypothetical protein